MSTSGNTLLMWLRYALAGVAAVLRWCNRVFGGLGAMVGIAALAMMVVIILAQVFFRYVLGNALPWSDEAARFMMLWMTGMLAPIAYRRGGFVAIDLLQRWLRPRIAAMLALALLSVSLAVLIVAVPLGADHVASGCLFKSSTLWLPFDLQFAVPLPLVDLDLTLCTRASPGFGFSWGWQKMPLALSFASLYVGVLLLFLVNVELMLRAAIDLLFGSSTDAAQSDI